ncbi:hypothetical protein HZQ24_02170 [Elizabethkingia anophelis]|uniref:hypothetical protein n=1 Tax=Elizabethkingia anophelis TaxID=1117645 RepID=UPI00099A23CF|nr:hypothetical protein [Elizabethkingia anophelis]MCT4011149.1 hypothetical protein [Elizabethkingia anophelis]MDV3898931.1 hypothetical protein [Elizabethkingia anophelis]OPC51080.1 hypothetical protein BAY06_07920 [Elizabethkingia anophelis]
MKKLLIFPVFFFGHILFSQTQKEYIYYNGYDDYLNNNQMQPAVVTYVKGFTPNAILIDDFKYKDSDKTAKKERLSWALKDGNDLYLSMYNASYIYQNKTFAKFSIIGKKYMVILLDENKDRKAIGYNNPYGGGLLGAALNMRPKSSWKDKQGNTFKILYIDVENPARPKGSGQKNAIALLLDTQKVIELNNNSPEIIQKLKNNEYYVEDFLEFVNNANK